MAAKYSVVNVTKTSPRVICWMTRTCPCGIYADNSVICMKETAQRAHDNNENIQDFAEEMVMIFKAAGSVRFWTNAKGQRCDEYGNLLSEDGEHRVFDIIKTDE